MCRSYGLVLSVFCAIFLQPSAVLTQQLEVIAQWNFLEYDLPYDYEIIQSFRGENSVLTGLEITADRVFVATPRLYSGVAATLASFPRHLQPGASPVLHAYPDWGWHQAAKGDFNCTNLISVYRIRQDSCGRLWALDSGVLTSLEDYRVACPPKIVIFDLATDQPVRIIQFPRQSLRPNSLLTNLIIDETTGKCDEAFLYISDTASPGLVMYDAARDTSWRIWHNTMWPDPDFGEYRVAGESFSLMDGIVGLAFAPRSATLFFQPLATDRIFSIATSALRKGPLGQNEALPVTLVGRKSSQGIGLAVDPITEGIIFSPVSETAVAIWQPHTNQQKVLAFEPDLLQFPAEVRSAELDGGNVWVLSTRFQKFFRKTVKPEEINIRILRIPMNHDPFYAGAAFAAGAPIGGPATNKLF